jgi:serine/threonine protein kinase
MKKLGSYQIIEQLGRGGMGVVLKGFDEKLHRHVAIKLLAPNLAQDADSVERFLREARAMARLNDPHVVHVYDADSEGEHTYMAMELVEGNDLAQHLKYHGAVPLATAVEWIRQAASGLKAAHEAGLLHRDIKLSNLMLDAKDRVKVTDFGIALAHADTATRLTGTGNIVGTPGCMAPEVCQGKASDVRSDLYSLGVCLFELLTQRRPFTGDTPMAIMLQTVEHNPPDVRSVRTDVDEDLASILLRLLAKNPLERIQSCDELIFLLRAWQNLQQASEAAAPDAAALKANRQSAQQISSGRFASLKRLNVLAETRRPMYLMGMVCAAFAVALYAQYWLGSNLYADLGRATSSYPDFSWVKRHLLFTSAGSILAYAAFVFWWMKTHDLLQRSGAEFKPKDSRIALALMTLPIINWYFSFRLWRTLRAHGSGTTETQSQTLLWIWWISFHLSMLLSLLAWWILPNPMRGGNELSYAITLEIFARALWVFAGAMCLAMMFRISWRIWRRTAVR